MKAVIQKVSCAKVTVGDELISSIGKGICVLIGIYKTDKEEDADYMARKILSLKIFDDSTGKKWQRNVKDETYEILCVSQFTLCNRLKGNKPDFHLAMQGPAARTLYSSLLDKLRLSYDTHYVKDGEFGAMMQVHIQNDGPVTIELDSRNGSS